MPDNPYDPIDEPDQWKAWQQANANSPSEQPPPPPGSPPAGGSTNVPGGYGGGGGGGYLSREDYKARNLAERKAEQLARGYQAAPPPGARIIGTNPYGSPQVTAGGITWSQDVDTNLWRPGYPTSLNEGRQALAALVPTAAERAGVAGLLPQGNNPTAPGTGAFLPGTAGLPGTLGAGQGATLPGLGAFNIPGLGVESAGRRTIYDNGGLNTMYANRPNGPQILGTPTGGGGRTGMTWSGTGGGASVDPALLFPSLAASVPETYVKGQGNTGDFNRSFALPFNIGPGGASLANVAGSNVQINGPAGSGIGMGFALTPQTPSEKFAATDFGAATGRTLNQDPALAALQSLALLSAQQQFGDAYLPALTAADRGQYSGIGPTGQQPIFGGMAPGPQETPYAPPNRGPYGLQDAVVASAVGGGGGRGGGAGAGGGVPRIGAGTSGFSPNLGGSTNQVPNFAPGAYGPAFGPGYTPPLGPAAPAAAPAPSGGGGVTASYNPNPGTGAYMNSTTIANAPPLSPYGGVNPAYFGDVLGPLVGSMLAEDEEEREGPGGPRSFATGGVVNALPMGPLGATNPKAPAAPSSIDASLLGSLASPGVGAAVQTTPQQQSVNPAENAIQPVQGPQSTAAVTAAPGLTVNGGNNTMVPGGTPGGSFNVLPTAEGDVLTPFYQAQQKNAAQQRALNETYANRWKATGLTPTAIQLQPGQTTPQGALPPGMYYDTSKALQDFIDQISSRQLNLAALGPIGDPTELLRQKVALELELAPVQEAVQYKTSLAGLGDLTGIDPATIAARQAELRSQNEPLARIQDMQIRLNELGPEIPEGDLLASIVGMASTIESAGNPDPYQDPIGWQVDSQNKVALQNMKAELSRIQAHNSQVQQAFNSMQGLLAAAGIGADQLPALMGQYAAQSDALKSDYERAMKGEELRNKIAALLGNKDPVAEQARLLQGIELANQGFGNVETARRLNAEISNLAQKGATLPGFAKGGNVRTRRPGDESEARGDMQEALGSSIDEGRIRQWFPGFAKGGNWIAGATKNAHGQFRAKAQAAGMSTRAYAEKMQHAPGRTGKQARLAKTLMGFAGGGSMTTEEPIIGIGMFSRQPRFQVGEPQYPGGPPMAERLQITPLNRPSLPLGGMRRAA